MWEITVVGTAQVEYRATTQVGGMDLGQATLGRLPLVNGSQPGATGAETLTLGGRRFECQIYDVGGERHWVSNTFPGVVKSIRGDAITLQLVAVEPAS